MAYEYLIRRYRNWYGKLLRFYPKPFRERFGEGMAQTFNDLCRERKEAGEGLFVFVLWVFVETSAAIIRERITIIREVVMKKWLRRICGAVVMGLTWAAIWAILSVLIGTITVSLTGYSLENHIDPLAALAMPGFIVGVVFYTVILLAEGGRRFHELSLLRLAAWGAVVGLLLGGLSFALGTPSARFPLWLVVVIIVGSSTLLSTVSAVGSALLFRRASSTALKWNRRLE